MIPSPWEIRDYGRSPVSVAAKGGGPCFAKVYVTEYGKRGRSPELLKALRMIAEAPAMLEALRAWTQGPAPSTRKLTQPYFDALAIIARIDGSAGA